MFIYQVLRQHFFPVVIISHRDHRFTGKFWKSLIEVLDTCLGMSTADHPQTDGKTERVNCGIGDNLRSVCADTPRRCSQMLPVVDFALNNAVHASTSYIPSYVNGLTHPRIPLTLPRSGFRPGKGELAG